MFAVMNNRGAQLGLYTEACQAQAAADGVNSQGLDVFAWVIEAPAGAQAEDMPGRGVVYG